MKKACVFCGTELKKRNKSNEHIIPIWLLDHLSIRDVKIEPTHMTSIGAIVTQRVHTLDGLIFGNVCEGCNGGWMSQLENNSKPILIDLIDGNRSLMSMSEKECFLISRWAFKTGLTLNSGSNFHKMIPDSHYKELYRNTNSLPQGLIIVAQHYNNSEPFYWQQGALWHVSGESVSKEDLDRFGIETYKITFSFGKLLFLVTYLPFEDYRPALWKGIHIPCFPSHRQCFWYERPNFPWNNTLEAVPFFHMGMEAVKMPKSADNIGCS